MSISLAVVSACTVPSPDVASSDFLAKAAAMDGANRALSSQDCAGALNLLLPFYESPYTDNQIRLLTSSAYGCHAGINTFQALDDLVSFGGNLNGSGFWEFMVQEFPASPTTDNKTAQSALYAIDAAMSTIKTGVVLVPSYILNSTSYNPQSILTSDRTDDSNAYMTFLGMALMGSMMNRNGAPLPNYHKSVALPWTTAATTSGDGCAFASGLLSFKDGLNAIISASSGSSAERYQTIQTFLSAGMDAACQLGCLSCAGSGVSCTTCPITLRDRTSCTGLTTDVNSCAAAGLTSFVNTTWLGPP